MNAKELPCDKVWLSFVSWTVLLAVSFLAWAALFSFIAEGLAEERQRELASLGVVAALLNILATGLVGLVAFGRLFQSLSSRKTEGLAMFATLARATVFRIAPPLVPYHLYRFLFRKRHS